MQHPTPQRRTFNALYIFDYFISYLLATPEPLPIEQEEHPRFIQIRSKAVVNSTL